MKKAAHQKFIYALCEKNKILPILYKKIFPMHHGPMTKNQSAFAQAAIAASQEQEPEKQPNPPEKKIPPNPVIKKQPIQKTQLNLVSEPILQFFTFSHLPPALQEISKCFAALANDLVSALPKNPERSTALRKILEAKDAAVRAYLYKEMK